MGLPLFWSSCSIWNAHFDGQSKKSNTKTQDCSSCSTVEPVHIQVNQPSTALSPLVPEYNHLSYSLRERLHTLLNAETVDTHVHFRPSRHSPPCQEHQIVHYLVQPLFCTFCNPPPAFSVVAFSTEAPHFSAASVNHTRMFAQPPLGSSVLHYAEP